MSAITSYKRNLSYIIKFDDLRLFSQQLVLLRNADGEKSKEAKRKTCSNSAIYIQMFAKSYKMSWFHSIVSTNHIEIIQFFWDEVQKSKGLSKINLICWLNQFPHPDLLWRSNFNWFNDSIWNHQPDTIYILVANQAKNNYSTKYC